MNLTQAASLSKKFAPILILLVVIGFLLIIIAIRYSAKKQPAPDTIEAPRFESLPAKTTGFNLENLQRPPQIPKTMAVYNLNSPTNFQSKASFFAESLNISGEPQTISDINLGEGLVYSDSQGTLVIYPQTITYQNSSFAVSARKLTTQEVQQKVAETLAILGFAVNNPQTSFSKVSGEDITETQDEKTADFVKFSFSYDIAGYPLISPSNALSTTADFSGNIIHFTFRSFVTGSAIGDYPIISFEQATQALTAGQAELVKITGESEDITSTELIPEVFLSTAYLGYFLPSTSDKNIQPVWIFEATFEKDGSLSTVTYVIPAIQADFLKVQP